MQDKHLSECLAGRESTEYILPFFWQHGENHDILARELDAIEAANLREFCVESRTHEQFCQDAWWEDFGFLLAEAQRRGMRVWLLDDKRFPTGYANGYVAAHPALRKVLLRHDWRDFAGPVRGARTMALPLAPDEEYVSVTAYRRTANGNGFSGEGIDLLPALSDGLFSWDIPDGTWRVQFVIRTHRVAPPEPDWIDMLSPESCRAMLTAVYEPHYAHFSRYFGNTFAGFFSDEPRFGNDHGSYLSKLGKEGMPLPWRDDLPALLADASGLDEARVRLLLPALFHPMDSEDARVLRVAYMDVITRLYRENFQRMLGDWCAARGVCYIGHVIEDMNTHQRLGYGAGHYFRSLECQDMGGMDIVLHQIIPGMLDTDHAAPVCENVLDPEFFHYILAKLPVSLSHLTKRMRGRAMCEIFGAFGWAEGVPEMKYLTDHMLSNGVNYFVPHAFSPRYPDRDCPPHFYAAGTNAQFGAFARLMQYMRRGAHMISGGVRRVPAAVLYNAEAEWSGGACAFPQEAGKALTRGQIEFGVLWEDVLPRCEAAGGVLRCGEEEYRALVVPESEYLPRAMCREIARIAAGGVPVLVAGARVPRALPGGEALPLEASPLGELAARLRALGASDVTLEPASPLVRYYRVTRDGTDVYCILSEDWYWEARFTLRLPSDAPVRVYDAWENRLYAPRQRGCEVELWLPAAGAVMLVTDGTDAPAYDYHEDAGTAAALSVAASARRGGEEEFFPIGARVGEDAARLPGMTRFAGTIRYEGTLTLAGGERTLSLGDVGEVAEVWLNGEYLGCAACRPYEFGLRCAHAGENAIRIDVHTNLGYRERDALSTYLPLPPSGLAGSVTVR